jgi:uncharacterized damage-inducible protein DinB
MARQADGVRKTMITRDYAVTMARYGAWQNEAVMTAADGLDDDARRAPRGLFFGSIMGTLNHLLWGDQIWLHRFADTGLPRVRSIVDSPGLCADWDTLVSERRRMDEAIRDWAPALDPAWLESELTWYSGASGREITRPRALLVFHLFNHQTHHRGQVHAALTAAGCRTGITDLAFMPDDPATG